MCVSRRIGKIILSYPIYNTLKIIDNKEKKVYTVKNYCMVTSLEQAYELKKKNRTNTIIGGNMWLRMGQRRIMTAIDLSKLGLDQIEETEEGFSIGCMVTLRQLETHEGLKKAFGQLFEDATKHIVGVQFRNTATVGGSIFPRFGFSDILTAFLACDSQVELYGAGRIPLKEFIDLPLDEDILTHIHLKKDGRKVVYESFRMTETDFPVLTCAVIEKDGRYSAVIGARPKCARLVENVALSDPKDPEAVKAFAAQVTDQLEFGSNIRGSAEYRRELSKVLIERCFS